VIGPIADGAISPFELRHASTDRAIFIVVPERRLLGINGAGPRGAEDFRLATAVLRTVADLVRTSLARSQRHARSQLFDPPRRLAEVTWPIDGTLAIDEILEALMDPAQAWRQMIELPNAVTETDAVRAIDDARRLGGRDIPLVRLIRMREGPSAQILRVGTTPLPEAVRTLLRLVLEAGARPVGHLHEIVLAEAGAVGPDRARSIVRVPIQIAQ
jgi:hypothetical protein